MDALTTDDLVKDALNTSFSIVNALSVFKKNAYIIGNS